MKPISTDIQNVIKYVPGLNCLVLATYFYNCGVLRKSFRTEITSILRMTCAALLVQAPFELLMRLLPTAEHLLQFLMQYLVCFTCAHILIKIQKNW